MQVAVLAGVFGIVGVVVGGITNWLVQSRLAARAEQKTGQAELQTARRIVGEELHTCGVQLGLIARSGRVPNSTALAAQGFLPLRTWPDQRAVLARHLGEDEWTALAIAVSCVERMRERLAWLAPGSQVDADTAGLVRDQLGIVRGVLNTLGAPPL